MVEAAGLFRQSSTLLEDPTQEGLTHRLFQEAQRLYAGKTDVPSL